jgi:sulfatase modifying factor 1
MFKNNPKYLVIGALMLMSFDVNDSNFESYTQKIPGTEVIFKMTPIPEGKYMMGSESSADEKPVHEVTIAPFWMGTFSG